MSALASAILDRWDTLLDEYDRRLQAYSAYAAMPAAFRHEAARRILNFVADWLESDDDTQLIQFIQVTTKERTEQGLDIGIMQYAVNALQAILDPLIEDVQTARLVWRTLFKTQEAITHQVIELHRQGVTGRKQAEQALTESQQLLQLVMNNIPQAIFWKDKSLTYLGCNRAFAADAGLASPQDIAGKTDWDMPWKEQAELYRADDSRVLESGTPKLDYEEPQTTPDGSMTWLHTSKVPLRDAAGNVTAVLGMYEDITERKRAEASLQESKQFLQLVMDNIPQSIFWKDTGLVYRGCNRQFVKEGSFSSPDQIVGKTAYDMPWADNAEFYHADDRRVIETDTPKLNIEEPLRKGDGTLGWLRTNKIPMHDAQGQVIGILSTSEDITERKRLEQQLQESLVRRGVQVQTSTEVTQEIAAAPALADLYRSVVTLIKERFNYYHAQIFRYEPSLDAVVLVTGYGEAGQKMLAAGHRLAMGRGVVGTSAATGQSILATDVVKDKDWQPNPNLPDTQGELAVPIKLRDEVLGILDVQSAQAGALTADDQLLLEGLCGQIAVAIEQRRAEDSLAEERNLMRTLIDTLPDLIYAKDVASRFILANTATADVMGAATPDDLLGKSDLDFYPRELAEQYWASEQPILRDGIPLINHEEPNVDAAGHQKWDITTKAPLRDAQDQIIGLVGVTRDITERKQAEIEVHRLLDLQSAILNNAGYAVIATTTDGVITAFNPTAERMLGYTAEECIGKLTPAVIHDPEEVVERARLFSAELGIAIEPGFEVFVAKARYSLPNEYEWTYIRKDGSRFPVLLSVTALRDPQGNITGFLGLANDITERKQGEMKLQETLQEVERLYRATTREGWQTFLKTGRLAAGYRYDRVSVQPDENVWAQPIEQAIQQNTLIASSGENAMAVAPFSVRGATIGALGVYDDPQHPLSPDELTLLQEIIEQGALAFESARLYQDSQRLAAREQTINTVTANIRSVPTVDAILQRTVEELTRTFGGKRATIRLELESARTE